MKVNGVPYRSLWPLARGALGIVDQTRLPHAFVTVELDNCAAVIVAIRTMQVRGAPLIGIAAAYGLALALRDDPGDANLRAASAALAAARPTAVNLAWALRHIQDQVAPLAPAQRAAAAWQTAAAMAEQDVQINRALGRHGAALIRSLWEHSGRRIHILTHCNAGWLATVDFGTALSAIYQAHDEGVDLHVWVDETRPRNQGLLTAWELAAHGVSHTLVVDNAGGQLMQQGLVDLAIVGADRVSVHGDVCNKIGTYLKALAAHDNRVPFYAAVPTPTIDWSLADALVEIPIEQRDGDEVRQVTGLDAAGAVTQVQLVGAGTMVANPAFDVTPARLVTGIITEFGVVAPHALTTLQHQRTLEHAREARA